MKLPYLHFVVALQCEAKPVIDRWSLKRRMNISAFPIYENGHLTLTLSGIGKTSIAAATAYTAALYGNRDSSVWLNIGIAGHQTHSIGEMFVIEKIIDAETQRRWYPPIVFRRPCPGATLKTVSRAETEYRKSYLYDMEASAFYATAKRFSTSEIVQCLKVISDNRASRAAINPKQVSDLVFARLGQIEIVTDQLSKMAQSLLTENPLFFLEFLETWHFTEHQKFQLKKILTQCQVLWEKEPLNPVDLEFLKTGKEVLSWIQYRLDETPVSV